MKAPYPYSADGKPPMQPDAWYPDCWATIGAISAVTRRIRFAVAVYVLPLRNIFEVARATGTLAILSHHRFILGAGIGWMKDEFDIYGVDFHTRGKRFDEQLAVLRKLWGGGMVEHHGTLIDFPPLQISPAPVRTVPIFTGGVAPVALETGGGEGRRLDRCRQHARGSARDPRRVPAPAPGGATRARALRDHHRTVHAPGPRDLPAPARGGHERGRQLPLQVHRSGSARVWMRKNA